MPTSDFHQISDVLQVVEQLRPARVLDVGVGFGKWGFLLHEILDVYYERFQPESWTTIIDGIEIHAPYRNPTWSLAYNTVHVGDVREILPRLGRYDLVLCCDVIEHFEKPTGIELINEMLRHAPVVIITTPFGFTAQGASYGNEHETHRSGWQQADLQRWPHLYKLVGHNFVAVIGASHEALTGLSLRQDLEVLGVKRGARELLRMLARRITSRFAPPR